MGSNRVYLYDTTLRDGAQTSGVDFSPQDKVSIALELDQLGVDYIEGGWPGANPTDTTFFADLPNVKSARISAFGMTQRAGHKAQNDPGLNALMDTPARVLCMVGKASAYHVEMVLEIERSENLKMIKDSVKYATSKMDEVLFDAEHFFDGYKSDPEFALSCLKAAIDGGARWVVLCDTNGGSLPFEIEDIVGDVCKVIPGTSLGIHSHDDSGNAVANSLSAVRAGARMVQGTINGLGERCGNASLISVIPSLMLKMGFETGISTAGLKTLRQISLGLDERLNRPSNHHRPYVGDAAFAHKGGLHVSAIQKDPRSYEHIEPETVGNHRTILVSDQAGRSNLLAKFQDIGLNVDAKDPRLDILLDTIKTNEMNGYAYDGAEASFELLARRLLTDVPKYFQCTSYRVLNERRWLDPDTQIKVTEATVKLAVNGGQRMTVAEGNGPVNALDAALRKALLPLYPSLDDLRLVDYKVRILSSGDATAAITRVMIESTDGSGLHWSTLGVSANVIDASFNALHDSIVFKLLHDGAEISHEN